MHRSTRRAVHCVLAFRRRSRRTLKTYRVLVRFGSLHVWALRPQALVMAQNPNAAKLLFDAQYGRGNAIGVSTQVV